jgi:hypothetical protein
VANGLFDEASARARISQPRAHGAWPTIQGQCAGAKAQVVWRCAATVDEVDKSKAAVRRAGMLGRESVRNA